MQESHDNSGFVLLIVLVVLAIAATVLAASARHCSRQAMEAGAARRALQVKWGMLSCRAICLPAAEKMLQGEAAEDGRPRAAIRRQVTLGGIPFHLVVSDEQAKANVNMLVHRLGRDVAAASVAQLQARCRHALQVRLRPGRPPRGVITRIPALYNGPDQLFVLRHPSELIDPETIGLSPLDRVTCWGSGKVNFKRADASVIREVAAGLLTEEEISKLLQYRDDSPNCTLTEALGQLKLPRKRIRPVASVLTDTSRCHSLWIVAAGRTRSWYRLDVIQEGDAGNDSRKWTFRW